MFMYMSSCQLIVTILMKFPPPPKVMQRFFRGAQDLVLVQLTLIMQKMIKKTLMGDFLGPPPQKKKMHCITLCKWSWAWLTLVIA